MDESLEEVQDGVLEKLHAGEPVDPEAVIAAHPEHAEALRRFFAVVDLLEAPPEPREVPPARLGEFRIVREIARGGMGVVYEAEQSSLRRRVALKVLPRSMRGDGSLLARFRREAEASARLRHPNIVAIYSVGEAGGTPFFAMELVEGGTSLAGIVRARREGRSAEAPASVPGVPDVPEEPDAYRRWAVETIAKIADALAYAHSRGILHRDVKPGNILIERDGTPRLTDFGLALDLEATSLTVAGEVFGSPQYMSPEQAFRHEEPLDERTDVYSLAVTLYELLTLRLPYAGTLRSDLFSALQSGRVIPPREADPAMPEDLERVLLKALRRDPKERYAGAADFAADLRAVLERRPVAAPAAKAPVPTSAASAGSTAGTGTAPIEAGADEARRGVGRDDRGTSGKPRRSRKLLWTLVILLLASPLLCVGSLTLLIAVPPSDSSWARKRDKADLPFLSTDSSSVLPDSPAVAPAPRGVPPGLETPDREAIGRLASGTHPKGEDVLRPWFHADLRQRRVLARDASSNAHLDVVVPMPESAPENVIALPIWEISVNGGPWRAPVFDFRPLPIESPPQPAVGVTRSATIQTFGFPLADVIGEAGEGRSLELAHRVTVHITRGREGEYAPGTLPPERSALPSGTSCTWTFGPDTLFVYDTWPDDYPTAVTGPDVDAAMRAALRPAALRITSLSPTSLAAELDYPEPLSLGPLPAACEVDLLWPGHAEVIGTAQLVARPASDPKGSLVHGVAFRLPLAPNELEQRFLLYVGTGELPEVRLVFRPSRELALGQPDLERYWGGTLDVTVPIER